jgi:hypothetical protein
MTFSHEPLHLSDFIRPLFDNAAPSHGIPFVPHQICILRLFKDTLANAEAV